ncbi:flavin monoamine oxidase family protein [Zeaxanthinibacter enoshimensis]|uniref:flavin monoamine oxidase family protein n=1 Tax=Zeaxanthinibacter enoshimensis TaxID=392009 RepID=UPI00356ADDD0
MKSNQSRRNFLRLSALSAGFAITHPLSALSVHDTWNKKRGKPQKVLILGAGMAGMSAALELIKLGHEVIILEGQSRAGGRIRTLREPFPEGLYADMGAARIPENHEWTMKYIKEYDLKLQLFNPVEGDYIHLMKGKRIRYNSQSPASLDNYPVNLTSEELNMGWTGISTAPFQELVAKLGDPKAMDWPPQSISGYDAYSLKEFLKQSGYSSEIADLLMIGWETKLGMDMSILEVMRELSLSFGAPRYKIVGGNDLLPTRMAGALSDHIQYGSKVLAIEQSENDVVVHVSKNEQNKKFTADRVICTFPLPVIKKMEFMRTLSREKQRAINELTYWDLSRTVIQVSDRYWKKDNLNGFAATDRPMEIWDPNYEIDSKRGLIAAYAKNDDSQLMDGWSDKERMDFAAGQVNKAFPGLMDHFEGGFTKCWKEDPWALGAHSIGTRNQMTALLPHLIKQEGRVYFAGEHASAYHGWIQGAIESGNRAAKEINSLE